MVQVLKPFRFDGRIVHPGDQIEPDPEHAKSLALGGLVAGAPSASETADPPEPVAAAPAPAAKPAASVKALTNKPKKPTRRTLVGK